MSTEVTREELERLRADAARWAFVRDMGLVWADRSFGEGCTPGRVGDTYATRFVDERMAQR